MLNSVAAAGLRCFLRVVSTISWFSVAVSRFVTPDSREKPAPASAAGSAFWTTSAASAASHKCR